MVTKPEILRCDCDVMVVTETAVMEKDRTFCVGSLVDVMAERVKRGSLPCHWGLFCR